MLAFFCSCGYGHVSQDVVRAHVQRAVSSGTHVDMRIFSMSRGNMDKLISDIVPKAEIVFPHLKPMFIDWSEAVGRSTSGENFDDLNVRRAFNTKLRNKLNPLPSSTNASASVSSATFDSRDYRHSQETSENVGLATSSEQVGKIKNLRTKEVSVKKKLSVPVHMLTTTSSSSVDLTKSKVQVQGEAAKVPNEKLNVV